MTKPSSIIQMLELSTAHVSKETAALLNGPQDPAIYNALPVHYDKTAYGWFVYAMYPPDGMPGDLAEALAFARGAGCAWVMFDCDATTIDGLKTYEW